MSFTIGIDASRNRSGGAKLILLVSWEVDVKKYKITKVHAWSYIDLINLLPDKDWLIKHSPKKLINPSYQLAWQRWDLPKELRRLNCDIILNTDGGTICRFRPSVTMSRDMLSYEHGEMKRLRYGKSWFRLLLLKFMQNNSFNSSSGVIFLDRARFNVIQESCGQLKISKIIPHGVGDNFKNQKHLYQDGLQRKVTKLIVYIFPLAHHTNISGWL